MQIQLSVYLATWGLLSQFPPFRYFPIFSALSNHTLAIEYHVYIWQVSPQLSCGDTCQIWMWFEESNMCFCQVKNFAYGEINERSLSNPHPRSRRNPRSRCAWLTGPEPRWGYARTSFGVDAAAEVTISKCNLWKSWTLELTSEFSHAHLTILAQCGMLTGFIKTMQAE